MSSTYQKAYTIPDGFPALLKAFTREILRSQPDNIYEFGAQYFANLLSSPAELAGGQTAEDAVQAENGGGLSDIMTMAGQLDIHSMSTSELEPVILRLFIEADTDMSGYLDRQEFANVLKSANLQLSDRQIREVLCEADENDDNVIEYKEFVPFMVDILQGLKASEHAQAMMQQAEDIVRNAVEDLLLHGMSKEELETLMLRIFRKADVDKSGVLSRKEFKQCLKAAKLGLSRKDINLIMSTVDVNHDGHVSYEEFVPVCFQVLVERFKDEIVANDVLNNQEGLQGILLQAMQQADPEHSGVLPQAQVKEVFKQLSYKVLGLSSLQLVTLLSQAPTSADGLVNYVPFIPVAASIIYSMYDVDSVKLRIQAVKELSEAGGIQQMANMDLDALRAMLEQLFREADVESTGQLTLEEVMQVLERLGTQEAGGLQLSDMHMRAMFTAIDADENGFVDWTELVTFICDALEHLERERYIASLTSGQKEQ